MSEHQTAPVATETLEAPVVETAVAVEGGAEAPPDTAAQAAEARVVSTEPAAAPAAAEPPAAAAAGRGGEKSAKGERGEKGAKKAKRHRAPRRTEEEFVVPSPEELEGIPSDIVREAVRNQTVVEGKVIGWNQGGFHVVVDGITGFCPRSSMELHGPKEPAHYLDQSYLFRVLRVEEKGHRLVVSHAAVLREEKAHKAAELRAALRVGATVGGRVISLADFGAFVDLGGIEGLIHVSEIRRTRVAHPSEVLKVGDEIQAQIVKLPKGSDRVSLSLKALEPDPWSGTAERYPNGGKFSGKILRKTEFGWFVELEPGVEGLLHPSQLPPGLKADDPKLAPGETIEGWVRELDVARHRISLSLRETPAGNPWEGVESKYSEGTRVVGTVEKVEKFGAFIVLEPGLTGLLPASEMGLPRGANVGKAYSIGKKVTLQVAHLDVRRKRISLTVEGKTLEGSKSDYQAYMKQARKTDSLGSMAAALQRLRESR